MFWQLRARVKGGEILEFKIGNKEFYFGRKPKVPVRETSVLYYGAGATTNKLDIAIDKEISAATLRKFAQLPVCRRAINITKNTLLNCEWSIEKRDLGSDVDMEPIIQIVSKCLETPNYGDTFRTLMGAAIEDILTGDCGAIEICESADKERPIWLYPVDGFTIRVSTKPVMLPTDIKYKQRKSSGGEVELAYQDLMYMNMNSYTYTPLGLSPIESAFVIINYLLGSQKYAGIVTSNAVPKHIINLGNNADQDAIVKFRRYFDEEIYGSGRIPIVGGTDGMKTEQIAASTDDGLYLQWQHFLTTIIAYTFNIDPKRFNEGSQTDRSTVDEQKENILDEAVRPLAKVIEENINSKVLGRLGLQDTLVFRFHFDDNEVRKKQKADRVLSQYNADVITLDEARQLLGYSKAGGEIEEFGGMLKSQFKSALNTQYALATGNNGGYNGVGKNRYGEGGE